MNPQDFLQAVEEYCRKTQTSHTKVGLRLTGRPNFVSDLRRSGRVSPRLIEVGLKLMRDNPNGFELTEADRTRHSASLTKCDNAELPRNIVVQMNEQTRKVRQRISGGSAELHHGMMSHYKRRAAEVGCSINEAAYFCGMRK